jgi:hypothetical protein
MVRTGTRPVVTQSASIFPIVLSLRVCLGTENCLAALRTDILWFLTASQKNQKYHTF